MPPARSGAEARPGPVAGGLACALRGGLRGVASEACGHAPVAPPRGRGLGPLGGRKLLDGGLP
eukprot:1069796-Alexandrium_andersonii.AAC.1